ncbi:MAG: YoaK family protein [Hyphomicrobium sp.]|uniref:DUF1275 family protein n=1 Tax=Hyphomicrobium sp. TaxID=82 RepID=UPI0039E22D22
MTLRYFTLPAVPTILSVTAGYVDTASFLALHGLFTSHVTGNFVTLGASLVHGASDTTAKILALPLFCVAVFATRIARFQVEQSGLPILGIWLATQLVLMAIAGALALCYGPFPDADTAPAISVGLILVVAMAIQNAFHRIHLSQFPPTTIMTGTTTQAMLDLADLFHGVPENEKLALQARVTNLLNGILAFATGCAAAAFIYAFTAQWVFAGAPILAAATIGFYIREKMAASKLQ